MNMNSIIYCGIGFNCDCKPKKFKEFLENNLFHFCMSNEEVELFNLFSERLNVKDENGKPKKMDESELEDIIEKLSIPTAAKLPDHRAQALSSAM